MAMKEKERILSVSDLTYSFMTFYGEVQAVRGVSFDMYRGETLGVVGESGSGKSVMAKTIAGLNPINSTGVLKRGEIVFDGRALTTLSKKEMCRVRASDIRMIFQDPMTSLNPTMKVGRQIQEGIMKSGEPSKRRAKERAIEMLKKVRLPNPEKRYNQYPHEFSGGMRQRAMIALAMAVNPKLLIADEPTTALDVTTQAQILDLMKAIQKELDATIMMITHDLGVIANIATTVAVMYAGKFVEYAPVDDVFECPGHPYTWGLLASVPGETAQAELASIQGTPPDLFAPPVGCGFSTRCPYAMRICHEVYPETYTLGPQHQVACWLYHPLAQEVINPITDKGVCHGTRNID